MGNTVVPELLPYNPVANPAAVVTVSTARFTVLSPTLIRMEYSPSGKFEDRTTLAIVNRNLPVPSFSSSVNSGVLVITTASVQLKYTVGSPFTAQTLTVVGLDPSSAFKQWNAGQTNSNTRNLLGTIRSLDEEDSVNLNCTVNADIIVHNETLHCEWGLVSRDGWALINDTGRWALDSTGWWDSINVDTTDLYLLAYGHNYKGALADFVLIGGRIAMVPRQAVGVWWTRWSNLNDHDVRQIIQDYATRSLPMDVFVLDMDWHTKQGWGGYTFDDRLFQYPQKLLSHLASAGLIVAANIHDDDGVRSNEKNYTQMATAMGLDPSTGATIPFSVVDKNYLLNLEDVVLQYNEDLGVSFWWIDWQQGEDEGGAAGGNQNPTIWLNRIRATDHIRRGSTTRAVVLARWGGLGNHRYQVGFSADVADLSWSALQYQPYFSFTATNVGFGFWSHDLEGPYNDYELYSRWIQWGAFSAVFRSHDRGMSVGSCADQSPSTCSIVKPWLVPNRYFEVNRDAMLRRERLLPYIYTAYRQAYDSGLSILRPMYYEFPEEELAYAGDSLGNYAQYFFGDDMFIAPILTPMDASTQMAEKTIWVPPGQWFEEEAGALLDGGVTGGLKLTKKYDLTEIPIFVRAGAVIPRLPDLTGRSIGVAARQYDELVFYIYPGSASGGTRVYEDDGRSTDYTLNLCSWTAVNYSKANGVITITVQTTGTFPQIPTQRAISFRLPNTAPPSSVTVNGKPIGLNSEGGIGWYYDGRHVTTEIRAGVFAVTSTLTVVATFPSVQDSVLSGIKCGISHATIAKELLDKDLTTPGVQTTAGQYLDLAAGMGETLMYTAESNVTEVIDLLKKYRDIYTGAKRELYALEPYQTRLLLNLWDEDRRDSCLCGSQECVNDNSYYQQLRVEGWQPLPSDTGAVPLRLYYSSLYTDNYATTSSSVPPNYVLGVENGYILNYQKQGTVPVKVYYSAKDHDHVTVATEEGEIFAISRGYTLMNATIGYIYPSSLPAPPSPELGAADTSRLTYAQELLDTCF